MGIKDIFKKGIEEFKRRSALSKEQKNLKQRKRVYSEQLVTLGKKAWEEHIDIDRYGNLEKLIASTQGQLDDLNRHQKDLDNQRLQAEEKRKQENDTFDNRQKEVEADKKEVDTKLDGEKKTLKESQKDSDNAKNRLNQIAKEEETLNRKVSDTQTPDQEKSDIRTKLEGFTREKEELNKKIRAAGEIITAARAKIEPLEEQVSRYQKDIDRIREQQKSVVGALDKTINKLKSQLDEVNKKRSEAGKEQSNNFEQLGEQLSSAGSENPALGAELSAVHATENEMAAIKSEIESLEARGTDEARGAYMKMLGICAAGVVIVIALIYLLSGLFSTKKDPTQAGDLFNSQVEKKLPKAVVDAADKYKKVITEAAKKAQENQSKTTTAPKDMQEAAKDFNTATGQLKKQADKIYGKEIVITDKATLLSVLPTVSGWEVKDPDYRWQRFGQLEGAMAVATYKGPDNKEVRVTVTDTGHASAILAPYMMVFNMNIARDNEKGYERVSTYNNIRVIEKYDKRYKKGQMTFIIKGRYLVGLKHTGENSIDLLKQFIGKFDFSKLQ
jgi:chromosome segregation ATPase